MYIFDNFGATGRDEVLGNRQKSYVIKQTTKKRDNNYSRVESLKIHDLLRCVPVR